MALIRVLVWTLLFVASTFCWIVVFEHGFSEFSQGFAEELQNLKSLFNPAAGA